MIVACFLKDGKCYFVTDEWDIYVVYVDGDDYTVEHKGKVD